MKFPSVTKAMVGMGMVAVAASAAMGGSSPPVLFWGRSGSTVMFQSTWSGTAWSKPVQSATVAAAPEWVVAASCPTRDEQAVFTIDSSRRAYVTFRSAGTFGSATQISTNVTSTVGRPGGVVYEARSGDVMVAAWRDGTNKVVYRTGTATNLSAESTLTLPTSTGLHNMTLFAASNSDSIMLVALNMNKQLYAAIWSGTAWGSVQTICTDVSISDRECYVGAFERTSGEALLVYSPNNSQTLKYRTVTNGYWSLEQTGPSLSSTFDWGKLAVHPTSNALMLAAVNHNNALCLCEWDGATWGSVTTACTSTSALDRRTWDVGYMPNGSGALVAYGKAGQRSPYYRVRSGSTWGNEVAGTNTGNELRRFLVIPGSSGSEMHMVWADHGPKLYVSTYTGSQMSTATTLETSVSGGINAEPFAAVANTVTAESSAHRIVDWREVSPQ
ncbi:MAG TPA: hypothetical protein VG797_09980 [Phycisphaerales bacterium]|nr:hypothetical protein [Phycisphaerales bacterium]